MENNELRNDFISLERNNSEFISLNRENKEVKENENVKFFNNTEDIVKSDVKKKSMQTDQVMLEPEVKMLGVVAKEE